MRSPSSLLASACLLAASANAHFQMLRPEVTGFDDRNQDKGPCGQVTLDFNSPKTEFHVGGDAVAVRTLHSSGTWLYRASLDNTASPSKWLRVHPILFQGGLGTFCQPQIAVPASWAGKKGIISAVNNAPDGMLYSCAVVSFVAGTGTAPSSCTNASAIQLSFTNDDALAALAETTDTSGAGGSTGGGSTGGGSTGGGNGTVGGGSSPSPTAASPPAGTTTTRPNGASRLLDGGNAVTALMMALLGAAYAL